MTLLRHPSHPTTVSAAQFNAAGDYLYRITSLPGANPFSVFLWFYIDSLRSATSLIAGLFKADGSQYQGVYINSLNLLSMQTNNGVTNGTALSAGKWYCLLYTRSGATHSVYLGDETTPMTLDITRSDNNTITVDYFLAASNGVNYINGRLARLRSWNAALTLAEGNTERTNLNLSRTANVYNSASLNGASDLTDVSGNSYSWTAAGTLSTVGGPTI